MNYILFLLVCVYEVVHSHMCVCAHVRPCTCACLHVVSRRQSWTLFHRSWLPAFWHRVQFSSPEWPMTLGNLPIATSSVPITHTKVCVDTLIWNRGVNSEPYPSLYSKILPTESPPWPCAPFNLIFWGLGIFMCLLFLTPWKYFPLIFYYQFSTPNSNED